MNPVVERIETALKSAESSLTSAESAAQVEEVRISMLGRKGLFATLTKDMGSATPEERREIGRAFNEGKQRLQELLAQAEERIKGSGSGEKALDVTLPGRCGAMGHRHPITQMIEDCVAIFRRMGFIVADGPEIETVRHNFDALNAAADHPSREMTDTFYFADGRLLRSQTSTVQIRTMDAVKPPIRIVAPGRCFRRDTPDATHSMNFHQIEGLYVDKNVSMADLKSVLQIFAWELFGKDVRIRLRPHFFPFTEPSVEYDFSCVVCGGKGCNVCKHSGWLEIAGAGMVNPNVFRNVGIDPEEWSGYAFGMGIERLTMLRHRISDIRNLYENDVRFLSQFN